MSDMKYGVLDSKDIESISLAYVSSQRDAAEMSSEEFAQKYCETYRQIETWSLNNKDKRTADRQEAERIRQEESKKHYYNLR